MLQTYTIISFIYGINDKMLFILKIKYKAISNNCINVEQSRLNAIEPIWLIP
jgi:hypothetical protein